MQAPNVTGRKISHGLLWIKGEVGKLKLINYIKSFAFHAKVFFLYLILTPSRVSLFHPELFSIEFLSHQAEVFVIFMKFSTEHVEFLMLLQLPSAPSTIQSLFYNQVFLIQSTSPSAIQCM